MNRYVQKASTGEPMSPYHQGRTSGDKRTVERRDSEREKCFSVMDMLGRLGTTDTTIERHESSPGEVRKHQHEVKTSQFCTVSEHPESENAQQVDQDLLISSHSLSSELSTSNRPLVCPTHNKNLDIICKIDRIKICSHCGLFGSHKDHTFQQESEFLEEIRRKELKLKELREIRQSLERNQYLEAQWSSFQVEIATRKRDQVAELREEYENLINRITNVKDEIEQQITMQYAAALNTFREEADACKREIRNNPTFERWSSEGQELLTNLQNNIKTENFNRSYNDYANFLWMQGEPMLKVLQDSIEKVKLNAKKTISELKTSSTLTPLIANLTNSLQLSQIHSNSQLDTSITSLDDIHRTLLSQNFDLAAHNEFIEPREMFKYRNSECLQKVLSPIAEASSRLGSFKSVKSQQKLNTSSFYSPESRKKQNNPLSHSMMNSTLKRVKSNSRIDSSMISPKNKARLYRSPETVKVKPNPLKIVQQYKKNTEIVDLNLSECELKDESLAYFMEKAMNSRIPKSINLEKNQLSMACVNKLMPFLVKCKSVNLSKTGLGEGCLDLLLKLKTPFAMEELNLTGNGLSSKRNKAKLEQLMKNGLKIKSD